MKGACSICKGVGGCADWCGDEHRNGFRLPVDIRDGRVRTLAFAAIRSGWSLCRVEQGKYDLAIDLSEPEQAPHSILLLATFDHYERTLRGFGGQRQ